MHVTQRGVNRGAIFLDDEDRRCYLHRLRLAANDAPLEVHAYVLMGNHVHILLTSPQPGGLSRAMRNLGQCHVQAFNRRHGRIGTLWQGRFKSCLVDSERYLMAVYRYIELNPVRAALVEHPECYPWSSVHVNLGLRRDPLVTPHACFLALHPERLRRAGIYRAWLRRGISDGDLRCIRAHVEKERALGSAQFQRMAEMALGRPVDIRGRGRPRARVATIAANPRSRI